MRKKADPSQDTLLITEADITALAVAKKGATAYFLTATKAIAPMREQLIRDNAETTALASAIRGDALPYSIATVPIEYMRSETTLYKGMKALGKAKRYDAEKRLLILQIDTREPIALCPPFSSFNEVDTVYSYSSYGGSQGIIGYSLERHDPHLKGLHTAEFPGLIEPAGSIIMVKSDDGEKPIGMMVDHVIVDGKAQKTFADAGYIQAYLSKVLP